MTAKNISFEFFPPRGHDGVSALRRVATDLSAYSPSFVSMTYGAGGTTKDVSLSAAAMLAKDFGFRVSGHLTCVGSTKEEVMKTVEAYKSLGIHDIVALRGDPPKDAGVFSAHPHGFADSCELVSALHAGGAGRIYVGAYPESHPESESMLQNVRWLKTKFESGASAAITQFFFDADVFLRFRDLCIKEGVEELIIPGILPIDNWSGTVKFAERCGASIPDWMHDAYRVAERDSRVHDLSVALTSELCYTLASEGVNDFHFYTLNKSYLTISILDALGYGSQRQSCAA